MTPEELRALADAQAEDEGLWFPARTAPEAYLQQELRRLHDAVERLDCVRGAEGNPAYRTNVKQCLRFR